MAQISAITVAFSDRLELKPTRWTTAVTGLTSTPVIDVKGILECAVQPKSILAVKAWVLPSVTDVMPRRFLSADIKNRYVDLALADPFFHIASQVDFLLGDDFFLSIFYGCKIPIDESLPTASNPIFEWILIGPVAPSTYDPMQSGPVSLTISKETLIDRSLQVEEPVLTPFSFTHDGVRGAALL